MVEDVPALLDTVGLARAHLVGISMGGGIAQAVALRHPDRVASLTPIATSPVVPLPPGSPELSYGGGEPEPPLAETDWSDPASVTERMVAEQHRLIPVGFDEDRTRRTATRIVARTTDVRASLTNHALLDGGEPPATYDIVVPTLLAHTSGG